MYLAAPFFSPSQIKTVELMETEIEGAGFRLLSPRRSGVLLDMDPKQRAQAARRIFYKNVEDVIASDCLMCLIDDRDTGVSVEIGIAIGLTWYSRGTKRIFTYTEHDYNLNVMIKAAVTGHARGPTELRKMLVAIRDGAKLDAFAPDMEKTF